MVNLQQERRRGLVEALARLVQSSSTSTSIFISTVNILKMWIEVVQGAMAALVEALALVAKGLQKNSRLYATMIRGTAMESNTHIDVERAEGLFREAVSTAPAMPFCFAGEDAPMDRQEAFSQFKAAEGSDINGELLAAKATFKQMKARRVELAGICNTSKQQIDTLRKVR